MEIVFGRLRRIIDLQIRSVGIDLGKTTFHLVALRARKTVFSTCSTVVSENPTFEEVRV